MEPDARLFHCCRCHRQVIVCRYCDRGQIYCGSHCSKAARQTACRIAARRYQQTQNGRRKHARRQQHYRARRQRIKKKVTHQGSLKKPAYDVLPPSPAPLNQEVLAKKTSALHCHFCQCSVPHYLRHDFIHRDISRTATRGTDNSQGP